jgi:hypothetical protein
MLSHFCRLFSCVLVIAVIEPANLAFGREGRDLIHKMPPISAQRVQDVIVQIPPLRPVAEPDVLGPAPPPSKVMSAPTAREAPPSAHVPPPVAQDAPASAEVVAPVVDAPLRLSSAETIVARPVASAAAPDFPALRSSTLLEQLWEQNPARVACGGDFIALAALPGPAIGAAGRTVLADFVPCEVETAGANPQPVALPPVAAAAGDDDRMILIGGGTALGVLALLAYVGRRRLRARAAARLSAMSAASSTAEYRVVAQMPTVKSPVTRIREFFDWLLISVGGLRRGVVIPTPSPAMSTAAPGSTLAKVAALMRGSAQEEPPPPPVDLSRIVRTTRAPLVAATALAEAMVEPLRDVVEAHPQTMRLNETAPAAAPVSVIAADRTEDPGAADDLVLVEPGDAVAASAAINAARLRLEEQR